MHKGRLILLLIPLIALVSCSADHSKIIVADYGNRQINLADFEDAFVKNSGGAKAPKDSVKALENFLDLYVNYNMKLRDAEVRGYKQNADMLRELNDYKVKVGSALLLEKYLYEPNLRNLYERRKIEYRVSYIYLRPDSTMNDAQVQELGNQLIKRIQAGEDFVKLVQEYSKDDYTKKFGGDVHYVTAGQVNNQAIEDAIYSTEPGSIYPHLVKTNNGYSILKITEKHDRIPSVNVAHILCRYNSEKGDTTKAWEKINEAYQKVKLGADFGEIARLYSEDFLSSSKKGELGFIERGKTDFIFETAAFTLQPGEVSKVLRTNYGYHIVKKLAVGTMSKYEEQKEQLKNLYMRLKYKEDYPKLTAKWKSEMDFKTNMNIFASILSKADTTKVNDSYDTSKVHKQFGDSTLFSLNGKSFSTDSLFLNLKKDISFKNKKIDAVVLDNGIKKYSDNLVITEKALLFDKEDHEFAKLVDDYENGMYLFKILDDEVWSKISLDSAKIKNFYDETKENYRWKDRVEFKEIYSLKDSLINNCYAMVASGYDFDSAKVKFNVRTDSKAKQDLFGLVEVDANELAKQAAALKNVGDISKPFANENGWSIVKLIKRQPAGLKTFEEARAEASSLLQDKESKRLEEAYLQKLKSIYTPKIHYDELNKAFKD